MLSLFFSVILGTCIVAYAPCFILISRTRNLTGSQVVRLSLVCPCEGSTSSVAPSIALRRYYVIEPSLSWVQLHNIIHFGLSLVISRLTSNTYDSGFASRGVSMPLYDLTQPPVRRTSIQWAIQLERFADHIVTAIRNGIVAEDPLERHRHKLFSFLT